VSCLPTRLQTSYLVSYVRLLKRGRGLRVFMYPSASQWYAYSMRALAEGLANLLFSGAKLIRKREPHAWWSRV
jgi:hypothetical protein